jgi:hypothetical protein
MEPASNSLENLAQRFRNRTLPREEWTHTAHLQVGAWHVEHFGLEQAIVELKLGIRLLNESLGTPNTATQGFHETITVAYAHLIAAFLAQRPPLMSFGECVDRLTNSALGSSSFLQTFYSREVLMSETARTSWVEPDLAALALPADIFSSHLAQRRAAAVPPSTRDTNSARSCRFCQ